MIPRRLSLLILTVASLAPAGCGYSSGGGESVGGYSLETVHRRDVRPIAVPIFRNIGFSQGDEFELTTALAQQIESRTPYKIAERDRADTVLEGEIISVARGNLGLDARAAIPQEQMYLVTVNFTWKDLRTGKILVDRRNFQQAVSYFPTLGESRDAIGKKAAAQSLAAAIVDELSGGW